MTLTDWAIALFFVGSLLAATIPEANAHETGWYLSTVRKPAITKAEIVEVAVFNPRCLKVASNLRGCYIPEICDPLYPNMSMFCTPGRIELAMRMPPWVKECVIAHERKHEQGYDHPDKWSDCH